MLGPAGGSSHAPCHMSSEGVEKAGQVRSGLGGAEAQLLQRLPESGPSAELPPQPRM